MMNLKTTGSQFLKYGNTINKDDLKSLNNYDKDEFTLTTGKSNILFSYEEDVFLQCDNGITCIFISSLPDGKIEEYVLHQTVKIEKGNYFNLRASTLESKCIIYFEKGSLVKCIYTKEEFIANHIDFQFTVDSIFCSFYNIKAPHYEFNGEKSKFYELIYIDNGKLQTEVDSNTIVLKQNDLIIFCPNSFHTIKNISPSTSSYLSIMFSILGNPKMELFNKKFDMRDYEINIINYYIKYYENDFYNRDSILIATLNLLLSILISEPISINVKVALPSSTNYENELLNSILRFIDNSQNEPVTVAKIANEFAISRSTIQTLFKFHLKTTPKKFINEKKMLKAKLLLKEDKYSVSEISSILGFSSIYYFSRAFKNKFKITPTAYTKNNSESKNKKAH